MMRTAQTGLLLVMFLGVVGCEEKLETGYMPRHLNASDSDRRAFYAPEFTPESHPTKEQGAAPDLMQRH